MPLNPNYNVRQYALQTLDIKGNGGDDVLLSLNLTSTHTGIAYDSTANQYNTTPDSLFEGELSIPNTGACHTIQLFYLSHTFELKFHRISILKFFLFPLH